MDEAVRLRCPSCGADRISWVAADQGEAPCPVCGQMVPVQRTGPPQDEAMAVTDYAEPNDGGPPAGERTHLPTKLDVNLPPEPPPLYGPPPGFGGYGPPMAPSPYGMPAMVPMMMPQPRSVIPVVVSLGLTIGLGVILGLMQLLVTGLQDPNALFSRGRPDMGIVGTWLVALLLVAGAGITYFVLLLVWVYRTHQDMEALTAGTHSPSPGLAMGLLFVPFMSPFWLWHVLRRLSERVSGALQSGGRGLTIGLVPLGVFLALTILELVAQPFNIVVTLNVQKSGHVTNEFLYFQAALLAMSTVGEVCLAVALAKIGRAAADYTLAQSSQLGQSVPGKMYPPGFGKTY